MRQNPDRPAKHMKHTIGCSHEQMSSHIKALKDLTFTQVTLSGSTNIKDVELIFSTPRQSQDLYQDWHIFTSKFELTEYTFRCTTAFYALGPAIQAYCLVRAYLVTSIPIKTTFHRKRIVYRFRGSPIPEHTGHQYPDSIIS